VLDEPFADRLKRLRKARGLRVTDVAAAAGVTEGTIRQMESGATKSPTLVNGLRIAKLLSVTPDYLATGTEGTDDDTGALRAILHRVNEHERRLVEIERRSGASPT
jgi:transcriptional regulator with XRE-family HTH domain